MKKFLVSGVVAALLGAPAVGVAQEVYSDDDKSIDVYGSIRGYVGAGYAADGHQSYTTGNVKNADAGNGALLMGLQTNSNFGFNAKIGDMKAKIEFGLSEPSSTDSSGTGYPGIRHIYGEYSFGDAGSLLFGKTNTPTVDIVTSDVSGNDAGANGFGGLATGSRKIQVQYKVAGFTFAVIQDNFTFGRVGWYGRYNDNIPRVAFSHQWKGETLETKVAGTYKHYSKLEQGKDTEAFHLFAQAKYAAGENLSIAGIVHYGMNGHLYGEQKTTAGDGTYTHASSFGVYGDGDVQRMGGLVQLSYKISDTLGANLLGGYQLTAPGGKTADGTTPKDISSYAVVGQLPFKLGKNVTMTPQVGYYASIQDKTQQSGLLAFVRARYDF